MGCDSCEKDHKYQNLSGWGSHSLEMLRSKLSGHYLGDDEVRVYTVASTKLENGIIRHMGSGPNLEGGLATLCTCKRSMREAQSKEYWQERWILGLTSRAKSNGFGSVHYFLYLMKVGVAFDSHFQLYSYLEEHNINALNIKNAVLSPLGDIYEREFKEPLELGELDYRNPRKYKFPHFHHSHGHTVNEEWESDIVSTPLLLGDINQTYVWQKPMIIFKENRGSGNKKMTMSELLSDSFVARA